MLTGQTQGNQSASSNSDSLTSASSGGSIKSENRTNSASMYSAFKGLVWILSVQACVTVISSVSGSQTLSTNLDVNNPFESLGASDNFRPNAFDPCGTKMLVSEAIIPNECTFKAAVEEHYYVISDTDNFSDVEVHLIGSGHDTLPDAVKQYSLGVTLISERGNPGDAVRLEGADKNTEFQCETMCWTKDNQMAQVTPPKVCGDFQLQSFGIANSFKCGGWNSMADRDRFNPRRFEPQMDMYQNFIAQLEVPRNSLAKLAETGGNTPDLPFAKFEQILKKQTELYNSNFKYSLPDEIEALKNSTQSIRQRVSQFKESLKPDNSTSSTSSSSSIFSNISKSISQYFTRRNFNALVREAEEHVNSAIDLLNNKFDSLEELSKKENALQILEQNELGLIPYLEDSANRPGNKFINAGALHLIPNIEDFREPESNEPQSSLLKFLRKNFAGKFAYYIHKRVYQKYVKSISVKA